MKTIALFLVAICLANAQAPTRTTDTAYLIKQKSIYELFWHVDQPTVYHPQLYQKARSFNLEDNIASFKDQEAVTEFLQRWKHGMLPRGEAFSSMQPRHYEEAVCLFRVLYSAKDFDTFYNIAVWARFHINEPMYMYALFVSVMHRQDTKHIQLPPFYEIVPHTYFNDEVLHKAYHIAMGNNAVSVKKTVDGVDHYYIPANYTGWYTVRDDVPEQKLSYFMEDIGLNTYYLYMCHDFPYWMSNFERNMPRDRRGEYYLYTHKKLLVRYYLERLSNDMGEIDYVDVNKPIVNGYYPTMHHHNGLPFAQRPVGSEVPLHAHKEVQALRDFHDRISEAIDNGYVVDTNGKHIPIYDNDNDGLNYLGNVIQGNADSVNRMHYGNLERLYRSILSLAPVSATKYNVFPSLLSLYTTSMRDPIFYGMFKNIMTYWTRYKERLPSYTHKELAFPGVKIEAVTVDKLTTFFDYFESMLNNGVSVRSHKEAQATLIKARQYRLNHKPFSYFITVNSDKNVKADVRAFIGPKYDVHGRELDLSESYMNFMQIDNWTVDLKPGTNKIERNNHNSRSISTDQMPSEVFYEKVVKALQVDESFTYSTQLYGFPERLLIPKGKREGMPFRFFVCVSQFDETKTVEKESPVWGTFTMDDRPFGYPFDRPVNTFNFTMPNFYMKDVLVYHKQAEELNLTV